MENFNNKCFDFLLVKIFFSSNIVFIKIFFQFSPNCFNEGKLFAANSWYTRRFWHIFYFFWRFVYNRKTSSKVFSNKVHVLSYGNPSVLVSINYSEYKSEKLLIGSESNKETIFINYCYKVLEVEF